MQKEHLEVILEDINGKFDLVLEGQESLRKEMHGIRDELAEKIDQNTFMIKALNQKIDGVDARLDTKIDGVEQRLEQKIDGVEQRLEQKIEGVELKLEQKIDGVELKLEQKIDGVEKKLGQKLDAVAADLKDHRADTESHRGYQVREE